MNRTKAKITVLLICVALVLGMGICVHAEGSSEASAFDAWFAALGGVIDGMPADATPEPAVIPVETAAPAIEPAVESAAESAIEPAANPEQTAEPAVIPAQNAAAWQETDLENVIRALTNAFSVSGNPVQCSPVEGLPFDALVTSFEPEQRGSGDPSPENVRHITGRTGLSISIFGRNLFPALESAAANGIVMNVAEDGAIILNGTAEADFSVWADGLNIPAGMYTFAANNILGVEGPAPYIAIRDSANEWLSYLDMAEANAEKTEVFDREAASVVLTVPAGAVLTDYVIRPQLEIGAELGEYEACKGNTFTAQFGEMVYGGRMNWITGELTVDYAARTFDGTEAWAMDAEGVWAGENGYSFYLILDNAGSSYCVPMCNMFKGVARYDEAAFAENSVCIAGGGTQVEFIRTAFANEVEWKDFLMSRYDAGTPVCIVYELAAPYVIQLSAQQIHGMAGVNTIYGEGGEIRVEGRKDALRELEERIAVLEAVIYADASADEIFS